MGSVGHEDLLVWSRFLDSSTPHREVFTHLRDHIVSSHDLDQRAWASQLDVWVPVAEGEFFEVDFEE
jgi:hypothetical protein